MMITLHRQIETVGLHRALISRASESAQRRRGRIPFHTDGGWGGGVGRWRRVTRRQTRRVKATLSALGTRKNNEIRRRRRGPRQTRWNYSFTSTHRLKLRRVAALRLARPPLLTAQSVCLSQARNLIEQKALR